MILSELVERPVQVHPLFIHNDGDDVVTTVSRRLLDVVRIHVLAVSQTDPRAIDPQKHLCL